MKIIVVDVNKPMLVVPAHILEPGIRYHFRLYVTHSVMEQGYSDYEVVTNMPPYNGTCAIEPNSGQFLICFVSLSIDSGHLKSIYLSFCK